MRKTNRRNNTNSVNYHNNNIINIISSRDKYSNKWGFNWYC